MFFQSCACITFLKLNKYKISFPDCSVVTQNDCGRKMGLFVCLFFCYNTLDKFAQNSSALRKAPEWLFWASCEIEVWRLQISYQ